MLCVLTIHCGAQETILKRGTFTFAFLAALLTVFFATAQQTPRKKTGVIVRVSKPYDRVRNAIRSLGGDITYEFQNVDAIAASVPDDQMVSLSALSDVAGLYKDVTVKPLKGLTAVKLGSRPSVQLNSSDIVRLSGLQPHRDGNQGQGIVVAEIDTGIANAPQVNSLSGSIAGGESMVAGDPLSATSTLNDPHGTEVASLIAAHSGFIFSNDSTLVQSLRINDPSSLIACPDPRFPGCTSSQSVVPMIGSAPQAQLYALKIFDSRGTPAPKSRVIAAMDRVITIRRNYDRGMPAVPINLPCGTEEKPCQFNSLPIQVINMSFGGPTLFAGRDLEDELTERLLDAGITPVVSAGNDGFTAMTGNSPGTGRGAITVGAESIASQERILADLFLGLGYGPLYRANKIDQTAWFSSRGPTADGRFDPDLIASGEGNYVQAADGSIDFVTGSSFSSPAVSGGAAVILSAVRRGLYSATQIRNALIETGNPRSVGDGSSQIDEGHGVVDINGALNRLRSGQVSSALTPVNPGSSVAGNIRPLGFSPIQFQNDVFSTSLHALRPGEVAQFFVQTSIDANQLTVRVRNVNPELPPFKQNPLFGDDVHLQVADAPTSFFSGRADEFVAADKQFTFDQLMPGLVRVAIQGDWTNAGRVSADLSIQRQRRTLLPDTSNGTITDRQTVAIPVSIQAGKQTASFELFWNSDWSAYPTNDLDMILCPPGVPFGSACNFEGATLNSPERVVLTKPLAGTWTVYVVGFTVNTPSENFRLRTAGQ